ncbi:saccharopine dehydrogenase C-terminal domain-containing protein [Gangjinia marincola]|uniref:Saccharopine dehydrogenase C-terminal domain-containing protein n=1 Tax=Gangjinia marincola TaxID=578463 RepID=A0ABP3XSW9_9FLAO
MQNILVIGAGKSTGILVSYLQEKSVEHQFTITVGDVRLEQAEQIIGNHEQSNAISLDILDKNDLTQYVDQATVVISMLPARFHIHVARVCLKLKKHMVTASYVSEEMQALDHMVKESGLVFMNEIGVDPGIDHMSAMQVIDRIRAEGGKMILFESFTGGLVAPQSDNNLWNYKFTWNPRNVVVAGQGGVAKFIQEGKYKYIPYQRLFRRTEFLNVPDYGTFEAYANRNSLKYRDIYGIQDVLTLYRGTMRRVGFSKAWNVFVQLGMTDDSYILEDSSTMSYRDFMNSFLPYHPTDSVELKLRHNLKIDQDDVIWLKLKELDLFNATKKIGIVDATPAQALQKILTEKWSLDKDDKDMIVMYHKFGYELDGKKHQIDSTMVVQGENQVKTAMAKTVGLPVAMAAVRILTGEISTPGVHLPIKEEIYTPILKELTQYGIEFTETKVPYLGYNMEDVTP